MTLPEKVTEQELIDRAIAPRVSKLEIDALLQEGTVLYDHAHHPLTICIFRHPNGFWLIGHSAPASPENYDESIGERLALQKVIDQLWQLEGFLLRSRLHDKEQADEAGHAYDHIVAASKTPPQPGPDEAETDSPDEEAPEEAEEDDAPQEGDPGEEATPSSEQENPNREPPPRNDAGGVPPGEAAGSQRRDYGKSSFA